MAKPSDVRPGLDPGKLVRWSDNANNSANQGSEGGAGGEPGDSDEDNPYVPEAEQLPWEAEDYDPTALESGETLLPDGTTDATAAGPYRAQGQGVGAGAVALALTWVAVALGVLVLSIVLVTRSGGAK